MAIINSECKISMRGHKKAYLREIAQDLIDNDKNNNLRRVTFIRKKKEYPLRSPLTGSSSVDNYYDILKLTNYPKHQWRAVIKDFQYVASLLLNLLKMLILIESSSRVDR